MSAPTTAAAVVDTAVAHGVEVVLGVPGTHNLELYRHVQRHVAAGRLRHVVPRHEQGAGYAADGWARATGRPAMVLTTSGPGLLNALTAAATSYADSVPALYVSPGVPRGEEGRDLGTLHETRDASGAVGRLLAASTRADGPATAAAAVARALAPGGRRRPRHVEVPLDVMELPWDGAVPARVPYEPPVPAPDALARAAALLRGDVVVLAGGGALDAGGPLRAVAEALDAPVLTTTAAKGLLDEDHPLAVGAHVRLRAAQEALAAADAVLVVGSELGDSDLWGGAVVPRAAVRVDVEEGQLDKNLAAGELAALHGDAGATLAALLPLLAPRRRGGADRAAALRARCRAEALRDAGPGAELAEAVGRVLPGDAVLAGDSSQVAYYGAVHFTRRDRPRRFCYCPGFATLGYALPAAVGAALALPGAPAVALVGDGALMFSVQELMTAVEQRLPVVTVVVDNGGFREIRDGMLARGIPPLAVDLERPDLVALARAFGADAEPVPAGGLEDALARALQRSLERRRPGVLVVDLT
ncbi:thiamine pyrophosphate-binding protein [Vallicoccus soli]|uniref:thiamine pyrophosphate-binding protein n=1 Tax=Vallicoccus soli TaxID=2339232 RepID=UPI0014039F0B|nr:thiamine pyrophosphate-binding protein [Vallicoccus soli]